MTGVQTCALPILGVMILKIEEIEELVNNYKGTQDKLYEEQLYFAFIPYINLLCSKFFIKGYSKEDLQQEAFLTLHNCIMKYKNNGTFVAYVTTALKNRFVMLLRESTKVNIGEINDSITDDNDIEMSFLSKESLNNLSKSISHLSDLEQKIIKDYYFNDLSLVSISKQINVKYITTAKKKDRAIEKLRRDLGIE